MREWAPTSFGNLLREVEHISANCEGDDPIALFRGHVDYQWRLDCTLVRTMLNEEYRSDVPYPRPLSFHTKLVDVLLRKFGTFWEPSQEAFKKELSYGIDPWFELMKRFQQYAKEDSKPKGTFLIDWTVDRNIALYFSTYAGHGHSRSLRDTPGAIWIWDPYPTGKVYMTKKLGEILPLMRADDFRIAASNSTPLILHPAKQSHMLRAIRQKPVYVSQMDYRYDLADIWASIENASSSIIFKKIILTDVILEECVTHLAQQEIDEETVCPDYTEE